MHRPVVTILEGDHRPSAERLRPVDEAAEVRRATADDLSTVLRGSEVLFLYDFFSTALADAWEAAGELRWVHVAAAGVDTMLTREVRDSDLVVTNSRGIFDEAIAEYVLGQMLAFAKDFAGSLDLQRGHRWLHRESECVSGTRALVVGTGPIGRAIARLLTAVGVRVSGAGRVARDGDPDFGRVVGTADLPGAFGGVDWVIAAAPLTEATRGMFDADAFAAMSPRARFINVARGELARTDDLVAALREERLAGAALDVVDPEPLPDGHELWDLPTVRITPHNAGDFVGWRDELVTLFAENFERWLHGEALRNVVDKSRGYVPSEGSGP